jgi:RNA polymerase sigma factor (sigma-70 family)
VVIVLLPNSPVSCCALDVGNLYRALAPRLEQIVRIDIRASDALVEDACQFAWTRLLHHAGRVRREAALSWLATTAVHEAYKLIRRRDHDVSFEDAGARALAGAGPGLEELIELRERLGSFRRLSERQQRLLWLHGLGLSYAEISLATGCTPRTVERQLLRAKRRIREAELA